MKERQIRLAEGAARIEPHSFILGHTQAQQFDQYQGNNECATGRLRRESACWRGEYVSAGASAARKPCAQQFGESRWLGQMQGLPASQVCGADVGQMIVDEENGPIFEAVHCL